MGNIVLRNSVINRFFDDLDNKSLDQVKHLVEQGAVLNPLSGELVLDNTRTGIYTDYFRMAFYIDKSEKPYQVGNEKLIIASRQNPYGDDYQYICIEKSPIGSDGWDTAMAWDPNLKECYGADCRVYQLQIEVEEGEWQSFPIWFENRYDAIVSNN